jgi:uncharacterized protein YjbK
MSHTISLEQLAGNYEIVLASDNGKKRLTAALRIRDDEWSWQFTVKEPNAPQVTLTQNLAEAIRKYNDL